MWKFLKIIFVDGSRFLGFPKRFHQLVKKTSARKKGIRAEPNPFWVVNH